MLSFRRLGHGRPGGQQRDEADKEREAVEQEGPARTGGHDEEPADGGADNASELAGEAAQRIPLGQHLTGHELGHDRADRRHEERGCGPEKGKLDVEQLDA